MLPQFTGPFPRYLEDGAKSTDENDEVNEDDAANMFQARFKSRFRTNIEIYWDHGDAGMYVDFLKPGEQKTFTVHPGHRFFAKGTGTSIEIRPQGQSDYYAWLPVDATQAIIGGTKHDEL